MRYLVVEIKGRQYLIEPDKIVEVDKLSDDKKFTTDKVLLSVNGEKMDIGKPFVSQKADFEVIGNIKKDKIRVLTYKAKANKRRVVGSRRQLTQIRLLEEKAVKNA